VLINSSRGPLIEESALLETLEKGGIRGAALDVWWKEPLPSDSPWRSYNGKSELVMSPHMGYVNEGMLRIATLTFGSHVHCPANITTGTISRWYAEQAENVRRFIAGEDLLNRLN
jgi:phosphoglycerate dehydrogenase-like enzyme